MDYRREIDGLRAFAVVPVVLFHAGFQGFSGGFVGVDIFFVISGYLITGIILAEKEAGRFTLAAFYERRARRILPALFVVMFACLPFAWFWLLPREMRDFSESLLAVPLFLSNHLFLSESGYFQPAAEAKPLLHTWSLAVEEQYYLLFPPLLMLLWRFGKRATAAFLVVLGLASLALAHALLQSRPEAAFYILPTRAWELLIGALIGLGIFARLRPARWLREAGAASGLALIVYAILYFDSTTPFPGPHALVPTLGAALIILFAREQTLVGKLLAHRLPVGIGLISYSTYLWHQPLLAFARHISPGEPSKLLLGSLAVGAGALAYLTWKHVETPFRNRNRFSRRQIFGYALAGSLFFVILGIVGTLSKGLESRLNPAQLELIALEKYEYRDIYRSGSCFIELNQNAERFSDDCRSKDAAKATLIWGDSHAAALSYGLRQILELGQYTASACPPLVSGMGEWRPKCQQLNDIVREEIQQTRPGHIILHANWVDYDKIDLLLQLEKTIAFIRQAAPQARITIVGPVPQWPPSLPAYIAKKHLRLDEVELLFSPKFAELEQMDEKLAKLAATNQVGFLSSLRALCQDSRCQATIASEGKKVLTMWDYGHLTREGSILLSGKLFTSTEMTLPCSAAKPNTGEPRC